MIETHVLNPSVTEIYSTTQPIETAHKSPQMLQELLTSAVVQLETELQDKLEKLLSKQIAQQSRNIKPLAYGSGGREVVLY